MSQYQTITIARSFGCSIGFIKMNVKNYQGRPPGVYEYLCPTYFTFILVFHLYSYIYNILYYEVPMSMVYIDTRLGVSIDNIVVQLLNGNRFRIY